MRNLSIVDLGLRIADCGMLKQTAERIAWSNNRFQPATGRNSDQFDRKKKLMNIEH